MTLCKLCKIAVIAFFGVLGSLVVGLTIALCFMNIYAGIAALVIEGLAAFLFYCLNKGCFE